MHRLLRSSTASLAFAAVLLLSTPAVTFGGECAGKGGPAATLLVPYFEVDLDDPSGSTTLFSVANKDAAATVARAVLWTNIGIPTLGFDLLVAGDGVVTVNLRDVFAGRLPLTGDGPKPVGLDTLPPGCTFPLALPGLGGESRADLRARHTGKPSSDGLCHGAPQGDGLATGYVTVDVIDGCLPEGRFPGDGAPYFAGEGPGGLAAERNVLWGDVFLIDAEGNRAEGLQAVSVPADPSIGTGLTFYYGMVAASADRRRPLPVIHRTRFLAGADSDTALILWSGNLGGNLIRVPYHPLDGECVATENNPAFTVRGWSERSDETFAYELITERQSLRIAVGSEELPVPIPFGTLELESYAICHNCSNPYAGPLQSWVGSLIGASGRFAVGLEAVGLGTCP
jgi:hypothetical protein